MILFLIFSSNFDTHQIIIYKKNLNILDQIFDFLKYVL